MLRAAVDGYGWSGTGLVDAMLAPVSAFVHDDPAAGEWGLKELDYMERNAGFFEAYLAE